MVGGIVNAQLLFEMALVFGRWRGRDGLLDDGKGGHGALGRVQLDTGPQTRRRWELARLQAREAKKRWRVLGGRS